ncbi:MAG TPA: MFS transporter [Candidatus Baltobacteraceae bacterium]|nr:MFS transporter [Candidatus Baltobacteraceae bacterium]
MDKTPSPAKLAAFWLGAQALWGALLGVSLQSRSIELAPATAIVSYSYLAAIGAVVAAIVQIAVGPLSDWRRRHGSKRIEFYAVGTIGGAIALIAFYDATNFATLTAALIALQATLNIAAGPYQAIIPDTIPRDKLGIASSWMSGLQSLGNAIGAVFATVITNGRILGATLAAFLVACAGVTVAHVRGLHLQAPPPSEPFRVTRAFVDLFISRALVYVGFYTLVGYLLFYVTGVLGIPAGAAAQQQTGIFILAFTVLAAIGAGVAAKPTDRMDKRLVATIGCAGTIAALMLFVASHNTVLAAFATAVAGLGWGVFLVADWAIACRILPPGALASTMGIWNVAVAGPQIVAPLLTAAVLQRLGLAAATAGSLGPRVAFGLALGETLLGIAWLWRLSRCAVGE